MRFFSLIYRYSRWLRRRFTRTGYFVLGGFTIAGALGFDTTQSMSYQIFTLLLAVLIISFSLTLRIRIPVNVHRNLPRFATVGESCDYTIILKNDSEKHQVDLLLCDNLTTRFPTKEEFSSAHAPGDHKRNRFDQKIGFPRWLWLVQCNQGAKIKEICVPNVPSKGTVKIKIDFTPLRRGTLHFGSVSIGYADPLGLAKSYMNLSCTDTIIVLPRRYPFPEIKLPGLRRHQRGGVALSSKVGDTEEFSSLRDYRPGDAMRRIHWKSWAKTGKPVVKEFQDEFFVRHSLILDTFSEQKDAERFEDAVSVAASLACTVHQQDSLLDLMFIEDRAYCMTSGRNVGQVESLLQMLAVVRTCNDKPFSRLAQFVTGHAHLMSGCVCVMLEWDEPRQALVTSLRAIGIAVLVIVITEQGSPTLDFGSMRSDPSNFIVLESGRICAGLSIL
jgi:uncharacterized protein (DUF58 family)